MSLSPHLSPVKSSIGVHSVFSCLVSCKGIIYTIVQNLSVSTSSTNPRSILLCGKGRRTLTWEYCSALQALKDHFCAVLKGGLLMILLSSKPLVRLWRSVHQHSRSVCTCVFCDSSSASRFFRLLSSFFASFSRREFGEAGSEYLSVSSSCLSMRPHFLIFCLMFFFVDLISLVMSRTTL